MTLAVKSITSVAGRVGKGDGVVETVLPDAKPWASGSTSQPTYEGQLVSLSPALHIPVYSSADAVAAAIDADVRMLGGLSSTMKDVYQEAAVPVLAAAMTGAAIYMPAPWKTPDARTQPWFQGALLPPRNVAIVVDLWSSDKASGVLRVVQVVAHPQLGFFAA
jgi:hypothetical protein